MPTTPTIDLTGATPGWPAHLLQQWRDCLLRTCQEDLPADGAPHIGDPELRAVLADRVGVAASDLVITSGVRFAVRGLCADADRVVVERPTFSGVPLSLTQLGLPWSYADWAEMLAGDRTVEGAVCWVTSPARNPDGRGFGTADLARWAAVAGSARRLVQNVTYRDFADGPAIPGACLVASFHKVAGPGARLGWAAGPGMAELLKPELRAASPARIWQRTWLRFVLSGGWDELTTGLRADVERARSAFRAGLGPALEWLAPDLACGAGPALLLRAAASDARDRLAAAGVLVGAGADFAAGNRMVRVWLAGLTEDAAFTAAQRVGRVLAHR
ncbi:hypothetical protein [Micromonospora sp. NPDC023644]|uniref:hypothetical protein n=1 Tax=Micromonospora sp. NPDC023644 TaxID=3154321 RepID=UPI0033C2DE35